jgi:pilus assembly protein Flp/PilA
MPGTKQLSNPCDEHGAVGFLERLARDESGATAVEYALVLGGIAAVIIVMVFAFGGKTNNLYKNTATSWP